ncbi:hypothetical protein, partial [Pseudomonas aeruginosa]|uniref:hypothetical protein n=1 Tax=Pseudomonas aeruginosa TaxID=287 RepID=UPI0021F0C0E8
GFQPLRQQAHLTGRLPLNLLFQQNRSIAAGRDYGVTGKAACKRWSARMQMLGQEEYNRVVKPVQLRINHGAPAGGCSPVAFSCSPARTQPFLLSGRPFRVGLLPL